MQARKKIPYISLSLIALALLCFVFSRIARGSTAFSDFFEKNISSYVRLAMSKATDWFSFSLFEVFINSVPFLIIGAIILSVIAFKRRWGGIFLLRFTAFVALIFVMYTLTTGISYHTTSIADRIGLDTTEEITVEDIAYTAERVIEEIDSLTASLSYVDGESRMEYSFAELSEKISEAYAIFNSEDRLFLDYTSVAKPIKGSETMTAFRLSGIYTFYTGESNINMAYPDYTIPYSVAHELAHARGIMRENEANFVAFLVCIGSPDPYIRYSGYVNILEYLISAIYKEDKDIYNGILDKIDERVLDDIRAASAVSKAYANSFIGNLSNNLNDMYLKANGTEGRVSYSMVTKLAVAYYR